jgi:hypothetical protein
MKDQSGFVKLFRSLVDWEWYDDVNTCKLFLHCLIKANYSTKKWQGHVIRPGEFITSLGRLAIETGLTVSKVRTAIDKLVSSEDLEVESTTQYTKVIIHSEYFDFNTNKGTSNHQDNKPNSTQDSKPNSNQVTNEQQTNNNQLATTNNNKEIIKDNKKEKFREAVFLHSQYSYKILNSFFNYWSELNKKGQMRFENETHWETEKRLQKWDLNENNSFKNRKPTSKPSINR